MPEFSKCYVGSAIAPCPVTARVPQLHWIEIVLVGEDTNPIPGMEYRVQLPTGEVVRGYLDRKGRARISGIPVAGTCQVTFPTLDQEAWHRVSTSG